MVYRPKYDYLTDEPQLKAVIEKHKLAGSIFSAGEDALPQSKLNFQRAENELKHADAIFRF